jgi:hypothetical protein
LITPSSASQAAIFCSDHQNVLKLLTTTFRSPGTARGPHRDSAGQGRRGRGSAGWEQREPLSFTQVAGRDYEEVAAVQRSDLADVEPLGEGDYAGIHHLQAE